MTIKAGEVFVEIFADSKALRKGLNKASANLRSFGQGVKTIGLQMAAIGAAFATPLIIGARAFASFENSMAKVGTLLNGNQKQLDQFSKDIKGMSSVFGESTEILAAGLFDIVSASIPADKAIMVLTASVKAAKAGFTDTAIAADAITTLLNAYKLEAEDAAMVSDFLFETAKQGKTDMARLAPTIGKVATLASVAGVSMNDMGAALATITRSGIRTEEATVALVGIINTFLKPAKQAADTARELGFELSAATLRTKGLSGVFDDLAKLDPDIISKLFPNIRATKGLLPVLQNLKEFKKDVVELEAAMGATDRAFREVEKTMQFTFNVVKQSGVAAFRELGESMKSEILKGSKAVIAISKDFVVFVKNNKDMVIGMAKVALALIGLGTTLVIVGTAALVLGGAIGALAVLIPITSAVVGLATTAMGFLTASTSLATIATAALSVANGILATSYVALTTPVGLAIIAIAAVIVVTLDALDAMDGMAKGFAALGNRFDKTWEQMTSRVEKGDLAGAFAIVMREIKIVTIGTIQEIQDFWNDAIDTLATRFAQLFTGLSALADVELFLNPFDVIDEAIAKIKGLESLNDQILHNRTQSAIRQIDGFFKEAEAKAKQFDDRQRARAESAEKKKNADAKKAALDIQLKELDKAALEEEFNQTQEGQRRVELKKAIEDLTREIASRKDEEAAIRKAREDQDRSKEVLDIEQKIANLVKKGESSVTGELTKEEKELKQALEALEKEIMANRRATEDERKDKEKTRLKEQKRMDKELKEQQKKREKELEEKGTPAVQELQKELAKQAKAEEAIRKEREDKKRSKAILDLEKKIEGLIDRDKEGGLTEAERRLVETLRRLEDDLRSNRPIVAPLDPVLSRQGFNPFAFERAFTSEIDIAKQQLIAQKSTAKNTKAIEDEVKKGGKFA